MANTATVSAMPFQPDVFSDGLPKDAISNLFSLLQTHLPRPSSHGQASCAHGMCALRFIHIGHHLQANVLLTSLLLSRLRAHGHAISSSPSLSTTTLSHKIPSLVRHLNLPKRFGQQRGARLHHFVSQNRPPVASQDGPVNLSRRRGGLPLVSARRALIPVVDPANAQACKELHYLAARWRVAGLKRSDAVLALKAIAVAQKFTTLLSA